MQPAIDGMVMLDDGLGDAGSMVGKNGKLPQQLRPQLWRRLWPMTKAYRLFLLLLAALQVADVVSTNHALATPGVLEGNPVIALLMAHLGSSWWLPKLLVVGYAAAAAPFIRKRWPMIVVIGFYVAVVVSNTLQF